MACFCLVGSLAKNRNQQKPRENFGGASKASGPVATHRGHPHTYTCPQRTFACPRCGPAGRSEAPSLLLVCPGRPAGPRVASMRRSDDAHSSIGPWLAGIASQEQLAAGRQLRRRGMAQPAEARRPPCCPSVPGDLQAPALLLYVGLVVLTVP